MNEEKVIKKDLPKSLLKIDEERKIFVFFDDKKITLDCSEGKIETSKNTLKNFKFFQALFEIEDVTNIELLNEPVFDVMHTLSFVTDKTAKIPVNYIKNVLFYLFKWEYVGNVDVCRTNLKDCLEILLYIPREACFYYENVVRNMLTEAIEDDLEELKKKCYTDIFSKCIPEVRLLLFKIIFNLDT